MLGYHASCCMKYLDLSPPPQMKEGTEALTFHMKGQTSNKNMIHITHTHSNIPDQGAQHGSIFVDTFLSGGEM